MNKNAKQWVQALRSGEYEQGRMFLNKCGKFCCLGVACEVFNQANPGKLEIGIYDIDPDATTYDDLTGQLPSQVQQWLGLGTSLGDYIEGSLANLNDNRAPFTAIADLIESEPAGLFKKEPDKPEAPR